MTRERHAPASPAERFSVCQHVLRLGDIRRDVAAALAAGANGFSVNASDLGDVTVADAAAEIRDAGLAVTSYIDPSVMRLGPAAPDLDAVRRAAEDAATFGAPAILFIAGAIGTDTVSDADARLVAALAAIGERIADTGVEPMLEPLHPIARELSYVHTVRHAVDVVREAGVGGVVIDTGASWWERHLVGEVVEHLDRVIAVQITGVRADEMSRRTYVREECRNESEVPVGRIVRDLVAAGYDGWLEHEVLAPFDPERRAEVLREDRAWFAALFAG
ncbi:MAG TPA: TIM barrel protein [Ilumatobacteraceae bacterium]